MALVCSASCSMKHGRDRRRSSPHSSATFQTLLRKQQGKRMLYERTREYLELNPGTGWIDLDTAEREARQDFREVNEIHLSEKLTQTFEEMRKCYRLRYVLGRLNLMYELLKIEEQYNSLVAVGKIHPTNLGLFDSKIVCRMRNGEWFHTVSDILPSLDVLVDFTTQKPGSGASNSPRPALPLRPQQVPSVVSSPKKERLCIGKNRAPRVCRLVSSKGLSTPVTERKARKPVENACLRRPWLTPPQKHQTSAADRQTEARGIPRPEVKNRISPLRRFRRSCSSCQQNMSLQEPQSVAAASYSHDEGSSSFLRSPRSPPYLGTRGDKSPSKNGSHRTPQIACERASSVENPNGDATREISGLGACTQRKQSVITEVPSSVVSSPIAAEDRPPLSSNAALPPVDAALRDTPGSEDCCQQTTCALFTVLCAPSRGKISSGRSRAVGRPINNDTEYNGGSAVNTNLQSSPRAGARGGSQYEYPSLVLRLESTIDRIASGPDFGNQFLHSPKGQTQNSRREPQQHEKERLPKALPKEHSFMIEKGHQSLRDEAETAVTGSTSRTNTFERNSTGTSKTGAFTGPTAAAPLPRIPTKQGIEFGRLRVCSLPGASTSLCSGMYESTTLSGAQETPSDREQAAYSAADRDREQEEIRRQFPLETSAVGPTSRCLPAGLPEQNCRIQQRFSHSEDPAAPGGDAQLKDMLTVMGNQLGGPSGTLAGSEVNVQRMLALRGGQSKPSTPAGVPLMPTGQTLQMTEGCASTKRSGASTVKSGPQQSNVSVAPLIYNLQTPYDIKQQRHIEIAQPSRHFVESRSTRILSDPGVRQLAETASCGVGRSAHLHDETNVSQLRPDGDVPRQLRGMHEPARTAGANNPHCQVMGHHTAANLENVKPQGVQELRQMHGNIHYGVQQTSEDETYLGETYASSSSSLVQTGTSFPSAQQSNCCQTSTAVTAKKVFTPSVDAFFRADPPVHTECRLAGPAVALGPRVLTVIRSVFPVETDVKTTGRAFLAGSDMQAQIPVERRTTIRTRKALSSPRCAPQNLERRIRYRRCMKAQSHTGTRQDTSAAGNNVQLVCPNGLVQNSREQFALRCENCRCSPQGVYNTKVQHFQHSSNSVTRHSCTTETPDTSHNIIKTVTSAVKTNLCPSSSTCSSGNPLEETRVDCEISEKHVVRAQRKSPTAPLSDAGLAVVAPLNTSSKMLMEAPRRHRGHQELNASGNVTHCIDRFIENCASFNSSSTDRSDVNLRIPNDTTRSTLLRPSVTAERSCGWALPLTTSVVRPKATLLRENQMNSNGVIRPQNQTASIAQSSPSDLVSSTHGACASEFLCSAAPEKSDMAAPNWAAASREESINFLPDCSYECGSASTEKNRTTGDTAYLKEQPRCAGLQQGGPATSHRSCFSDTSAARPCIPSGVTPIMYASQHVSPSKETPMLLSSKDHYHQMQGLVLTPGTQCPAFLRTSNLEEKALPTLPVIFTTHQQHTSVDILPQTTVPQRLCGSETSTPNEHDCVKLLNTVPVS
uniref:Uncharacterized protein n=1 Tax=Toxoplasma gondii (strain ATCC 50861 / VEG) TaxID=432359 RepID=A0A0F7V9J1_TOXGV|nr:TPA: hypothetical protein BN1205_063335 [Toxoplasma gondii VEG]